MEFLNDVSLAEITGKDTCVVIQSDGPVATTINAIPFLRDGKLMIDCIPKIPGKYLIDVPDDAVISRAMQKNVMGEYLIVISPHSPAGQYVLSLVKAARDGRASK